MSHRNHGLTLLALVALVGATGCLTETTLTIHADGTCTIRAEYRAPRAAVERLLAEQLLHREQDDAKAPKDMTDAELIATIRKRSPLAEAMDQIGEMKSETLEIKDGTVRIAISVSVPSLHELLTRARRLGPLLPATRRMVVSKNAKGHLRLEMHGPPVAADDIAEGLERLAPKGMKLTYRIVLPGKILTSTLPETQDKATWIAMDIEDPEKGVKQLAALFTKPIVITAEPGGLKITKKLDTAALDVGHRGARPPMADAPVVEATKGFVVSPVSVMTVSYGLLRKHDALGERSKTARGASSGVTIHCEMLLPKGHTLISSGKGRVVEAVDDKGRAIPLDAPNVHSQHYSRSSPATDRTFLDLRVPLPQRGVRALKHIEGEALVVTSSKWKTFTVADARAAPDKKLDMGKALPDATLEIRKMGKGTVDLRIVGKKGGNLVDHLQYALKFADGLEHKLKRQGHSMSSGPDRFTCTLNLANDELRREGNALVGAPTLILRAPDDVRTHKVTFTLHNVPLLEPAAGGAEF